MLGGAAFVALGVTAIGYEITMAAGRHAGRQIPGGLAAMAGGLAVIGLGLVLLAGSRLLAGAAFTALGVAAVGYGLTLAADWEMLGGALGAVGGMAAMTAGAALLAGHQVVGGTATVGGGLAVMGLGAALLDLPRIKSRVSSWCKEWTTETEPSQDQGPSRLNGGLAPWPGPPRLMHRFRLPTSPPRSRPCRPARSAPRKGMKSMLQTAKRWPRTG